MSNPSLQVPEYVQSHKLSAKSLLPYNELHDDCERLVVYFASRIAVVMSTKQNSKQRFYEGHKFKVTCIAVHPSSSE